MKNVDQFVSPMSTMTSTSLLCLLSKKGKELKLIIKIIGDQFNSCKLID